MKLEEIGSLLAVGAVLAGIGKGITSMVFRGPTPKAGWPGWRGVFYVTMWAHPILTGAVVGFIPTLPAPEFMGDGLAGRIVWYALSGVVSSTAYDAVHSWFKHKAERRASQMPPDPKLPPGGSDAG